MGQSTDGQICYGILLEEEIELPWDEFDDREHDWWRKVNNYKPPFTLWTPEGEYVEGYSSNDPRVRDYYTHQFAWDKAHPLPFKMVNCCSGDYPIWIIAVPDSFINANRGEPTKLLQTDQPSGMICTPGAATWDEVEALIAFCKKHGIAPDAIPAWYLSSYWG